MGSAVKKNFGMMGIRQRPAAALGLLLCVAFAGAALAQTGYTPPPPGAYVDSNGRPIVKPQGQVFGPGDKAPADLVNSMPAPPGVVTHNAPHTAESAVTDDGGITLNFVNADVRDVAHAVLGDFLGLNYAVGAGVQGTVTIQTSRPVSKADVLPVLEQALQMNGLALVKNAGVYNVVLLADARHQTGSIATSRRARVAEPGFGAQIVPLKYVGATEMQHLLEPLVPSQAIVYADASRNFIIIEGSEAERAAMVDEIGLFDVDWLAGMSFALLTPKYTDVTALAKELDAALGGEKSPLAGVVRLVPIQRLNSILAISTQPRYLAQLQHWVDRLDQPGQGSERRIFFYAVQNGRASDLSDALNRALYGEKPAATGNQTNTQQQNGSNDNFAEQMQMGGSSPQQQNDAQTSSPAQSSPSRGGGSGSDNAIITVDKSNNALLVYGTPQQYAVVENVLHQMDVAPIQIQLEAAIAEVSLNDGLQYGVQYFYQPSNKHNFVLSDSSGVNITPNLPGFSYMFTEGSNIKIILSALSQVTHVEVMSSPEVMVLNNNTAILEVGNQVPISTGQAVSTISSGAPIVNSIEYHATGVILKVTPGVNKSGMVTMDVSQEVSDVAPDADQNTALGTPTFEERKIQSTIVIQDGETVALGGLISDRRTRGSSGIPFLSALPVVGGLFGTKTDNRDRTELMVLITPHVIDNLQAARAITDELRQKFPSVQHLLRKNR
jgi:general secretion pathway protein D